MRTEEAGVADSAKSSVTFVLASKLSREIMLGLQWSFDNYFFHNE